MRATTVGRKPFWRDDRSPVFAPMTRSPGIGPCMRPWGLNWSDASMRWRWISRLELFGQPRHRCGAGPKGPRGMERLGRGQQPGRRALGSYCRHCSRCRCRSFGAARACRLGRCGGKRACSERRSSCLSDRHVPRRAAYRREGIPTDRARGRSSPASGRGRTDRRSSWHPSSSRPGVGQGVGLYSYTYI